MIRRYLILCNGVLVALLMFGAVKHVSAQAAPPHIDVEQGMLEGVAGDGYDAYLGIPFAAPPIGELRWAPPASPVTWQGVRPAVKFQSKCPQEGLTRPLTRYRNEDCLYLNVYQPHSNTTNTPVIVWFHGGGYVYGSSQDVDGSVLARRADAIIVTVNYRLGVFGFLSLPQLDAQSSTRTSGNYAILDQQAALRWVRANIARFGGDPNNVTMMGQSAGGSSIWIHLTSPANQMLFSRAIVLSSPPARQMTKAEEQEHGASSKLVASLNCGGTADVLACIRSRSTESVFEAGGGLRTRQAGWAPVVDGVVNSDSAEGFARTIATGVPILAGTVAKEGGFFIQARRYAGVAPWTTENYRAYLAGIRIGDAVGTQYPLSSYASADAAYTAIVTDILACANVARKGAAVARRQSYFMYQFDDPDAPTTIYDVASPAVGPFHGAEIPYFFQTAYANEENRNVRFTDTQKALSDRMIADVRTFTHGATMDPSRWAPDKVLSLTSGGDSQQPLDEFATQHKCEFWRTSGLNQLPL